MTEAHIARTPGGMRRRTHLVQVRLNGREHDRLRDAALRVELSIAELVRTAIAQHVAALDRHLPKDASTEERVR